MVEWPTKYPKYDTDNDRTSKDFDLAINQHALIQAEIFLEKNASAHKEETQWQVCVLGYLVFKSRYDTEVNYISTSELIEHLNIRGYMDVTPEAIRSSVIAKLRDSGVIVVSSNKGYKIPRNYSDCREFVERVNSIVLPLLERLNKARKSYLMASKNEIDLLKGVGYPELVEFLDELNKNHH